MNSAIPRVGTADLLVSLRAHGVEESGLAAIRAFARVVPKANFARAFAMRLGALAPPAGGEVRTVEAEAQFCAELVSNDQWPNVAEWYQRVSSSWERCIAAGTESGFALQACAALVKAASDELAGGRAVVYQLEIDILFAIDGFAWAIAAQLVEQVLEHERGMRLRLEEWDALTGLPNRRRYGRLLGSWLAALGEERRVGLVVLTMDWGVAVQHLPLVEQDRLRLVVANRLREAVRPGDLICSTGDHDWSLLLPAMRSPAQVRLAANKLVAACESLLDGEFRSLCGTLSAGGAVAPDHGRDPTALEYAARTALVIARRNGVSFEDYREDYSGAADEFVGFERELLNALHLQAFELHLQPQVRLQDGVCEAAELLLRWQRRPGEWVPPPAIIDGAQRLGVLPQLSRWLIMRAARIAEKLAALGVPVRVNLNLTAFDLRDEELPDLVEQALSTWRVEPHRFGLEVTESALVADQDTAAAVIGRLRALGCPVALDDFGTGFSSLAYLRNLPVTELKIDQMFVRQLRDSRPDQAIVGAIMLLARGFGLRVVAEGVEDVEARDILREAGCDLMQGFLESRALPLDKFIEWWRQHEGIAAPPAA